MRLIDADKLKIDFGFTWDDIAPTREEMFGIIDRQPTVDAVEVVRCKDCVYGEQDDIGRWFCNDIGCQVGDEDGSGFCADAERKEKNRCD